MDLDRAVEVSVRAFCQAKSRVHPYIPEYKNGVWVMQDAPGKRVPRKTEVMAVGYPPEEAVLRVREAGVGWHFLCDIHPPEAPFERIRQDYKAMGYRALATEWIHFHDLKEVPVHQSDPPCREIKSQKDLDAIKQRASQPWKLPGNGARLYCIADESDYGWVTSVPVDEDAWVANLFVHAQFRGLGYGRALMSRLMQDDKALGVRNSVLIASTAGARLYPHLGYQEIGVLQIFCPKVRG